nr:MAG TPA: hypothetical protein [Caudoviricetes sp.]
MRMCMVFLSVDEDIEVEHESDEGQSLEPVGGPIVSSVEREAQHQQDRRGHEDQEGAHAIPNASVNRIVKKIRPKTMLAMESAFLEVVQAPMSTVPNSTSVSAMSIRSSSIFLLKTSARAGLRVEMVRLEWP